nr:hypothetical protein [Tanacetum cinerariifolium]
MSSPNHPTSDIEDAFSSNSPDYTPASPGNTSSDSSNSSYGLVLIASPTLLLFHDDPYMKVMHAYDNIMPPQVPIPLPIIVPPSPIMAPKRTSTSAAPTMNQAVIRQLIDDRVVAALEAQAANMANTDNTIRNSEPRETPATRKCTYKEFMSCQPFYFNGGLPRSIEGNVTASKPQTLEEAINITQRLMDQVTNHNFVQGTYDHKQKFDDSRNTDNNNYPDDRDNENHYHNRNNNNYQNNYDNNYNNRYNNHHQQHNRRQEAIRSYTVNPTKNSWSKVACFCWEGLGKVVGSM